MPDAAYPVFSTNLPDLIATHLPVEHKAARERLTVLDAERANLLGYLDYLVSVARAAGISLEITDAK